MDRLRTAEPDPAPDHQPDDRAADVAHDRGGAEHRRGGHGANPTGNRGPRGRKDAHDGAPAADVAPAGPVIAQSASAPDAVMKLRLLEWVAREKPMLAHTVELCDLIGPDPLPDGRVSVRIELATDRQMHRDRLATPAVRDLLRAGLREVLGRDVELEVPEPPTPPTPPMLVTDPTLLIDLVMGRV